jgi:processive 1,2-diacylglycerol beta-glucosyltransferase
MQDKPFDRCHLGGKDASFPYGQSGPPMRKDLLILHCRAGGGHTAAAEAIAERARARDQPVRILDALSLSPPWFARAYVDAHLRSSASFPRVYGTTYFALNHRSAFEGALRRRFDDWIAKDLLTEVIGSNPLAVVTTHFFPMGALGRARLEKKLSAPLIEVVTDYAAHAVWAEPGGDVYCAPPGRASDDLVSHGVPPSLVASTGIPVRLAFAQAKPIHAKADGEPLRVLVTSGGFGVGPVTRVLTSFVGVPGVALDVVCGNNAILVEQARALCERLGLDAEVLGYESNMAARVAAADVIVSKPGGLTMSECMVAGRPLVLVGAVPGQETLNQTWAVNEGLAVASEPDAVGSAVASLRGDGLVQMAERARALAIPRAADAVLDVALAARPARGDRPSAAVSSSRFGTKPYAAARP